MIAGYIIGGAVLGGLLVEFIHTVRKETKATVAETPDADPRNDVEFKLTTKPDPFHDNGVVKFTYTNGDVETCEIPRECGYELKHDFSPIRTVNDCDIYTDHVRSRRILKKPDDTRTRTYDDVEAFVEAYNEALQSDDRQLVGYTVDD